MPSVVFDTNILFSGVGWKGSPYSCLQLAREGKVTHLTCIEILSELNEKLQSKMGQSTAEAARTVAEILSFSKLVTIENKLKVVTADPDDDKIVECAVAGKADFIVSGDKHLLDLGKYGEIPIVRAGVFLNELL
jgi:putative PIN family toxin of toxin-antitoxin system